jgi:DNA-binding CsgD family transcriptional regulator
VRVFLMLMNILLGGFVFVLMLILSYSHTADFFARGGYTGTYAHLGAIGCETLFFLSNMNIIICALTGRKVPIPIRIASVISAIVIGYSNVSSGFPNGGEAIAIGVLIFVIGFVAELVVSAAIISGNRIRKSSSNSNSLGGEERGKGEEQRGDVSGGEGGVTREESVRGVEEDALGEVRAQEFLEEKEEQEDVKEEGEPLLKVAGGVGVGGHSSIVTPVGKHTGATASVTKSPGEQGKATMGSNIVTATTKDGVQESEEQEKTEERKSGEENKSSSKPSGANRGGGGGSGRRNTRGASPDEIREGVKKIQPDSPEEEKILQEVSERGELISRPDIMELLGVSEWNARKIRSNLKKKFNAVGVNVK